MDLPVAYIPVDRRLAMACGVELPERMIGAALFADISGFTPLTEMLARELGPKRGVEEVTRYLNTVYSALIAQVDRYRGSVIGFSGDAITCWLDGDDGRKAVACGLAMQSVMRELATITAPSGATITLAVKAAIACGTVRRFLVGDPHIQLIDVLAGVTLDRLAAAEHQAGQGEVVASAEVVEQLQEAVTVIEWRQGEDDDRRFAVLGGLNSLVAAEAWPQLPPEALAEDQVRPWLLPGVYDRLRDGQGEFVAELRPAVALFTCFGGIDYDRDSQAAFQLDAYIRWVQRIVARYEGALIQLTIGDKGSYFYVAFGAPLAHDDDSIRAVATALDLQSVPPELAYITGVQIGISRGRMRTGPYGALTRRTYGVLGDDANLAARLMGQAGPGQILVSQQIATPAASLYDLRPIGLLPLRGKQAPVPVSTVLGRRPAAAMPLLIRFDTPLVGREPELARLEGVLQAALSGNGQIVRLEGAAGVGKSHLAAEMVERARRRGVRVATGASLGGSGNMAYAPWRDIFFTLLSLHRAATGDPAETQARQIEAVERFVRQDESGWRVRWPLLADLLSLPIPDNPMTAALEPRLRQSALFSLAGEMLQSLAQAQPLLMLLDDAHWLDEASRDLLLSLRRMIPGTAVLLVLVHRPPLPGAAVLPELDELPFHHRLNLDELSSDGVAALIANRLSGQASPLALSLVLAETQGNPFFVEQLVDALRESGRLVPGGGEWRLSDRLVTALRQAGCLLRDGEEWVLAAHASLSAVDLGLPDSIQGVVLSRMDRLPEPHRLTLKVASVVGRSFALDLVQQAHPLRPTAGMLAEEMSLLEERDFTRMEIPARQVHIFKHTVTHDVAYETLLFDQRRQLHRLVGVALEGIAPDDVGQLAYHTFAGEDWSRALRYQLAAGQQAQRLFANHEAIDHFEKALRCAAELSAEETTGERLQIRSTLGELLTTIGQYDLAVDHLAQARVLAIERGDRNAEARVCRWWARVYELRGEYSQALEWIRHGLEALEGRESAEAAQLHLIAGLIASRQGHHDRAFEACRRALRISENVGQVTVLARAYALLGHLIHLRGDSIAAIDPLRRALDLYRQAGDIQAEATSHNLIANAYLVTGQWSSAEQSYRRAAQIFGLIGDIYNLAIADNNLGEIRLRRGDVEAAISSYQEALRLMQQIGGSPYILGILHNNLGASYVRQGNVEAAHRQLITARDLFNRAQVRDFLPELQRHFAEAALLSARLDEAETCGQQSLALAHELGMRGEEGCALRVLGEIAHLRGNFPQAEEYLAAGLNILRLAGQEYESARTEMDLAGVYLAQGKVDSGLACLEHSVAIFERLDAVLDLRAAAGLGTTVERLRQRMPSQAGGPESHP